MADIERSSLILCGKAFADTDSVKDTLAAVAAPVISARKGIPMSARYIPYCFSYFNCSAISLKFNLETCFIGCTQLKPLQY